MNSFLRVGAAFVIAAFVSACGGDEPLTAGGGPVTFEGTYTSTTVLADGFTHTDTSTVHKGSATGYHSFTNGNASGSFSWIATVVPGQSQSHAALSGSGTINNAGTRSFTLTGAIDVNPDGSGRLWWSGNDPVFGPIGGQGVRPPP